MNTSNEYLASLGDLTRCKIKVVLSYLNQINLKF